MLRVGQGIDIGTLARGGALPHHLLLAHYPPTHYALPYLLVGLRSYYSLLLANYSLTIVLTFYLLLATHAPIPNLCLPKVRSGFAERRFEERFLEERF